MAQQQQLAQQQQQMMYQQQLAQQQLAQQQLAQQQLAQQQLAQQQMAQQQMAQKQQISGINQINQQPGAPFNNNQQQSQQNNNQQQPGAPFNNNQQQSQQNNNQQQPQNNNQQNILNKIINNTKLNLNEIHTTVPLDDDSIISISSVKPNARIEVTETLKSHSDTVSSINSSDVVMSQNRKKRIVVATN
jgi:hypothetical protein